MRNVLGSCLLRISQGLDVHWVAALRVCGSGLLLRVLTAQECT